MKRCVMKLGEKVVIPSRSSMTLDTVNGDLRLGKGAIVNGIKPDATVEVDGRVYCEGDNTFKCSLKAERFDADGDVTIYGDLEITDTIEVEDGRLEVYGKFVAERVNIDEALYVSKDAQAKEVDVGGSVKIDGNAQIKEVDVGGSLKVKGELEAESIDVGGSVSAESKVDITTLDVGGSAVVAGGKIKEIDIGGSFESTNSLEFEHIDVGGTVRLSGKSKGGEIDVEEH